MRQEGVLPQMKILQEVIGPEAANSAEKHWIEHHRPDLTNSKIPRNTLRYSKAPTRTETAQPVAEPIKWEHVERNHILQTLQETGGNKLETAKRLGIGRQTLYNRLKLYASTPAPSLPSLDYAI